MKQKTKYAYEKRIRELELENRELATQRFEFRLACTEIYDACIEVTTSGNTGLKVGYVLGRLKRVWMKI